MSANDSTAVSPAMPRLSRKASRLGLRMGGRPVCRDAHDSIPVAPFPGRVALVVTGTTFAFDSSGSSHNSDWEDPYNTHFWAALAVYRGDPVSRHPVGSLPGNATHAGQSETSIHRRIRP